MMFMADQNFDSIYDMGNPAELTAENRSYKSLAYEVLVKMESIYRVNNKDEYLISQINDFSKAFYRQGGLTDRLKVHLDFNIELFDKANDRHQSEIYKILYLFYILENKTLPEMWNKQHPKSKPIYKFELLKLLSNPSMENIDNSFLGWKTNNGKIINIIKTSLEKELSLHSNYLQLKAYLKKAVSHIVLAWDYLLDSVRLKMDILAVGGFENDINEMPDSFKLHPELEKLLSDHKITDYSHSPVETLYLKMLQHEQIGQIRDIMKSNQTQTDVMYDAPPEYIKHMFKLHEKKVFIDGIEKYIDDNISEVVKYVFLNSKTSDYNRKQIQECKGIVHNFIKFSERARPLLDIEDNVTALMIISCLQVVTSKDKNFHYDNRYHGYLGGKGKGERKTPQHWRGAFKSGFADDALGIYLVRKVVDRWYANLGRSTIRVKLREVENACDTALLRILTYSSIYDMLGVHSFCLKKFSCVLGSEADNFTHEVEWYLLEKGFGYIDIGYAIRNVFLHFGDAAQIYNNIIAMIDETLKDKDTLLNIKFEDTIKNNIGVTDIKILEFELRFDYEYNVCTMADYRFGQY